MGLRKETKGGWGLDLLINRTIASCQLVAAVPNHLVYFFNKSQGRVRRQVPMW